MHVYVCKWKLHDDDNGDDNGDVVVLGSPEFNFSVTLVNSASFQPKLI